ncbi:hypothetical protein HYT23_00840 [Candidatus Pacearchaeota archaeon]|nr:hypothetical protein [Candidatus Pacearchaeota archaeon]
MKQVLLDTSFILTCIKQKIDFFEEIFFMGLGIIIPEEVIKELELLVKSRKSASSAFALKLLSLNKFEIISLKTKKVDQGIINYARKNPLVIVATLDGEIKRKLRNHKLVIKGKKKLDII